MTSQSWSSPRIPCRSRARRRATSAGAAEAELRRLEHVAQPLGGDAHVVLLLDVAPASGRFGANERISSRRTRTIRAAFSASGSRGSSFLTRRAFTPRSSAASRLGLHRELREPLAERREAERLDERLEPVVRLGLLGADLRDEAGNAPAVGGGEALA